MDYYMATKWIRSHDLPDLVPLSLHRGRGLYRKYTQHSGERAREDETLNFTTFDFNNVVFTRGPTKHEAE